MTEQDLIDRGYKKYNPSTKFKNEDHQMAKMMRNEHGKMFQIVIYVYDWSKYPQHIGEKISFMPVIYLHGIEGNDHSFDTETILNIDSSKVTIEEVESFCLGLWRNHGEIYIDK